jgi:hypothetical protein
MLLAVVSGLSLRSCMTAGLDSLRDRGHDCNRPTLFTKKTLASWRRATLGAASTPVPDLAGVPIQEAQSLLIEFGRALVDRRVRAGLEHQKLATLDSFGQRVGETQRGHLVVAAKSDLGRRFDMRQLGDRIVGDHRVRLAHEGV